MADVMAERYGASKSQILDAVSACLLNIVEIKVGDSRS